MRYTIEKDVPLPETATFKPTLDAMEVGDSFLCVDKTQKQVHSLLWAYRVKGRKFTTRQQEDGVRVWRIT